VFTKSNGRFAVDAIVWSQDRRLRLASRPPRHPFSAIAVSIG
jgi:hypothetical protein